MIRSLPFVWGASNVTLTYTQQWVTQARVVGSRVYKPRVLKTAWGEFGHTESTDAGQDTKEAP